MYVKHDDYEFIYHMFFVKFDAPPTITINPEEHQLYRWEKTGRCTFDGSDS